MSAFDEIEEDDSDSEMEEEEVEAKADIPKQPLLELQDPKDKDPFLKGNEDQGATGATNAQQQSKVDGKGVVGKYDLWTKAPFPGLFYPEADFKKLVEKRQSLLNKTVNTTTGIPTDGDSITVNGVTKIPKDYDKKYSGSGWGKAAKQIARGQDFRHPKSGKIIKNKHGEAIAPQAKKR